MSHDLTIVKDSMTSLERKQELLAHHVRLVARKMSHALFVFGSQGGLGKSRTIRRTLDDEGISPILLNSHVTPLALFTTLYTHRQDQVIIFDDVDSMFSSMLHLGLLRSALWGILESSRTTRPNSKIFPQRLSSPVSVFSLPMCCRKRMMPFGLCSPDVTSSS